MLKPQIGLDNAVQLLIMAKGNKQGILDAKKIINNYKITSLFVVEKIKIKRPIGIVHLHDCLRVNK